MEKVAAILFLIGSSFELAGIFYMSRKYMNLGFYSSMVSLFFLPFNHSKMKNAVLAARITEENARYILKGLFLVAVGFIIVISAAVINLFLIFQK